MVLTLHSYRVFSRPHLRHWAWHQADTVYRWVGAQHLGSYKPLELLTSLSNAVNAAWSGPSSTWWAPPVWQTTATQLQRAGGRWEPPSRTWHSYTLCNCRKVGSAWTAATLFGFISCLLYLVLVSRLFILYCPLVKSRSVQAYWAFRSRTTCQLLLVNQSAHFDFLFEARPQKLS